FGFAPVGWALCDGQELPIAQNQDLFSLIGTKYGGDGVNNFKLPDLRGRLPVHMGTNPQTGTSYALGSTGGAEAVTLADADLPAPRQAAMGRSSSGDQASPEGNVWAASALNQYSSSDPDSAMGAGALSTAGGGQPHENVMPFQAITFIIALTGVYPPN